MASKNDNGDNSDSSSNNSDGASDGSNSNSSNDKPYAKLTTSDEDDECFGRTVRGGSSVDGKVSTSHQPLTGSLSLGYNNNRHNYHRTDDDRNNYHRTDDDRNNNHDDNRQLSNSQSMYDLQNISYRQRTSSSQSSTPILDSLSTSLLTSSSSIMQSSSTDNNKKRCKQHEYVLSPSLSMSSLSRPRSLMESLLIAKMEKAGNGAPFAVLNGLGRTESLGSTTSLASTVSSAAVGSDVCACDDCLLGIADLSIDTTVEENKRRKKPSGWRKLRSIVQWTPFFQTYKKQRYPWIQLAGHQGNFRAGREPGTILKKLCLKEEMCFQLLMKDVLKPFVPEYRGSIKTEDDERYLQLQDLLSEFSAPCVMDVKIGVRTYLEEELAKAKEKPKLRKDMYEKMIQIDPNAPSDEENRLKGVTKPRYMVWRETISSTATLGFRIEGIRKSDGKSSKDFKTTKTKDQIIEAFRDFVDGFPGVVAKYIKRLNAIKDTLEFSKFFNTHEIIGSSLLFVHDKNNASVWLIDFAKTVVLPLDVQIKHDSEWIVGNHEDGYLIGLNNLIDVFSDLVPSSSDSREIHDAI